MSGREPYMNLLPPWKSKIGTVCELRISASAAEQNKRVRAVPLAGRLSTKMILS